MSVTYLVRMIAKEGKAEEVGETLRINFSNVQDVYTAGWRRSLT